MKKLGGLFNNHGNIPIPLKIILYNQAKNLMMGNDFQGVSPQIETQPRSQGFSVRTKRDTRKTWSGQVTFLHKKWQYLTATR
jgi:hypothetical protein